MGGIYEWARPVLFRASPEQAHRWVISALKCGIRPSAAPPNPKLSLGLWGLRFASPLGLAAGFDKNAQVPDALLKLGFGFVEVGSVTLLPQSGNPEPRLFRLVEDRALVNRLGFNNEGEDRVLQRLSRRQARSGIIGVNIGANKDAADPIADYVTGLAAFNDVASYLAINISSPNTPGLRQLQSRSHLQTLLERLSGAREKLAYPKPLVIKIAPDLEDGEIDEIAEIVLAHRIDGVIVSNTTLSRPPLKSVHAAEIGGLSGGPLFELSTRKLARFYKAASGRLPLIGVGGVSSADTAWQKLRAGASLLQLYTALVYEGPGLIRAIHSGLAERLRASGKGSLSEITGSGVADWL
ncbi:MAG TPA: quinone-dependent dihydroorotate dehydrogenase [Aestuariivirgaceae bacterium]|jgi:dihydroorotate dehydrogenase